MRRPASPFRTDGNDVLVSIFAKPKSSRTKVTGAREGALEVQIAGAPSDGEANRELRAFLAKTTGHPRSRIVLERGEKDRHKVLRFLGAELGEIAPRLLREVAEGREEH